VARRTNEIAERLDISEWLDRRSRPGEDTLTGGVLRLVSFALATVVPAPLVVLDEPTNDVDPVRRRLLWAEIRRLADSGHAVVLVTHNVVEAERSLDRVLLLHRGRLILDGRPSDLVRAVEGQLRVDATFEPGAEPDWPPYLLGPVVRGRSMSASLTQQWLPDLMTWGAAARAAGQVEHFSVGTSSLDDVYLRAVDADDRQRDESPSAGPGRAAESGSVAR
jgi:ABC-2 type transport system ATP-binding protein